MSESTDNKKTQFYDYHVAAGGKMVPFAGYLMPVQYPLGIMQEHLHTRDNAGLFDVSHMGQVVVRGNNVVGELEQLMPLDLGALAINQQSYATFTSPTGGILDDLIITRWAHDTFFLVVNAACKEQDIAHLKTHLPDSEVNYLEQQSLIALQGLRAVEIMAELAPQTATLVFMQGCHTDIGGIECYVTRSGYTGEDGFEILMPLDQAVDFWQQLLGAGVKPCGLGARDTLRLEAGMSLYGTDMDESTSPLCSGLGWTLSILDDRNFIGKSALLAEKEQGVKQQLVGIVLKDKGVLRNHLKVVTVKGEGEITSGSYSPTLGKSIALARIPAGVTGEVDVEVRNKMLKAEIVKIPFARNGKSCI